MYALLLQFVIFCLNLRAYVAIFASLSQFTQFCRGTKDSAIYAFWEPKKTVNLEFRAKKTEFPAMPCPLKIGYILRPFFWVKYCNISKKNQREKLCNEMFWLGSVET